MTHRFFIRTRVAAAGLLCFALMSSVRAQQSAAPGPLAPEKYKNIRALTDIPADLLPPTMNYFVSATGIECQGCHLAADFTADTELKKTTRTMIDLVRSVNKGDLLGKISCATCHAGKNKPAGLTLMTPDRLAAAAAQAAAAARTQTASSVSPPPQPVTPTVDEVISRYTSGLGGRTAIDQIQTRTVVGTMTAPARTIGLVIEQKGDKCRESVTIQPDIVAFVVFDGRAGWSQRGDQVIDLDASQVRTILRTARPLMPDQIKQGFTGLVADRPQSLPADPGGAAVAVNVLVGSPAAGVTERLYFDAASGLLVRRLVTMTTAVWGSLMNQVDYLDYRAVSGVKMAHTIRETSYASIGTLTLTDIKTNTPIDDAKFIKPKG